jgi:hypothetical protein
MSKPAMRRPCSPASKRAYDVWRRSGVPAASLVRLAEADAFQPSLNLARREALWAIKALLAPAAGAVGVAVDGVVTAGAEGFVWAGGDAVCANAAPAERTTILAVRKGFIMVSPIESPR